LTRSKADDEHPSWSPDGTRLAFASGFDLRGQGHPPWLMTIRASGGSATRVGRFSGVLDPSWSPAGVG
jgi:Tol biopolymer transport system component